MKLDDIAIPDMTFRELITKAMYDDWNTRKEVKNLVENQTFHVFLTLKVEVPGKLARTVLAEVQYAEAMGKK